MTTQLSLSAPSDTEIYEQLRGANPALLLATLVTITGDSARIAQFAPKLTHEVVGIEVKAKLAREDERDLHAWAVEVLRGDLSVPVDASNLSDDDFVQLCTALVGMPFDVASAPFLREQGGFRTFVDTVQRTKPAPKGFALVVIGAGMAGIAAAIHAQRNGINCIVLEREDNVGGVWRQHDYPGVGVDTACAFYSLSFELNPHWTHPYPEGEQYRAYLDSVADKYGIRDTIRHGCEVEELRWNETDSHWDISYRTSSGLESLRADAVITAAGYLSKPQLPDIPGRDTFAGTSFHSAQWNLDCDVRGQRVAVIGTGCTSVQIVDSVIDDVSAMTVFQRQPHWVMPSAGKEPLSPAHRWLAVTAPSYNEWYRLLMFLPTSDVRYNVVRYDENWAKDHDVSISAANDVLLQAGMRYLDKKFADRPDLKAKLTPSFAPYGKRIIRDPGRYFDSLKLDKTTLVACGIDRVVPEGIVDREGNLHEVDVIVYATGYEFKYLSQWTIAGRDGVKLTDVWQETPVAYNSCQVPGFPNLFITSGPNGSPGHAGSHTTMVECVLHYIFESLQLLFETGSTQLEPTPEALASWEREMRELLADSVWGRERGATTYYRNQKGDVTLANPLLLEEFWARLQQPLGSELVLV